MLWAVHISDGVLSVPWLLGGIGLAVVLALLGSRRVQDEEVPRIALLTAAFFVASSIHIRIGPATSVHLLLNGLVGVILGWRAALAIPIALLLQAFLLGHGGFVVLGVNACVIVLPALAAGFLFGLLRRLTWIRQQWFAALLVGVSALVWTLSLVYSVTLLGTNHLRETTEPFSFLVTTWANRLTFHPVTLGGALCLAGVAVWLERRLRHAPEFALGLLLGETTVLATVILNGFVLLVGGNTYWTYPALLLIVAHLPIAVVEGVVVGFMVSFLARVKPDMLRFGQDPTRAPSASR